MSHTQLTTFYKNKYRKTRPKLEGKNILIHIHNPHLAVYIKFVGKHKWHVFSFTFFFIFESSCIWSQQKPKRNPILYILEITYLCWLMKPISMLRRVEQWKTYSTAHTKRFSVLYLKFIKQNHKFFVLFVVFVLWYVLVQRNM